MIRRPLMLIVGLCAVLMMNAAVDFDKFFADSTLRLDYIFAGGNVASDIYLDEMGVSDGWAGRRHNLERPFLRGNGQVIVCDRQSGDTIYTNSFSTLFQEWQNTLEATFVSKAFENTLLVPFPKQPVDVTLTLTNNRGKRVASLTHTVDPKDILIRQIPPTKASSRYVHQSGNPEQCVDIAIVAEGYTADEVDKFYADAERVTEALFSHEPFQSLAERFNVLAVATLAEDSGPDVPREGVWNRTAHRSHFDTFYSDRYLTTQAIHGIYDSLAGLPFEHIILLVNTPRYGGGGIFNQITISSADHPTFKQVLVHEFGHAYAGLADEYFYLGEEDDTYPLEVEPWEPNITTLVDFDSKWADMLPSNVSIPTPKADAPDIRTLPHDSELLKQLTQNVGVFEGAGYKSKGVYRPAQECRMKVNEVDYFCPVCTRAIIAITDWYTR